METGPSLKIFCTRVTDGYKILSEITDVRLRPISFLLSFRVYTHLIISNMWVSSLNAALS